MVYRIIFYISNIDIDRVRPQHNRRGVEKGRGVGVAEGYPFAS